METDCLAPIYLDASFKGVPFKVLSSTDEMGRRGDLYEYPLSEDTAWKDLGRKARRFKIEGYLVGGDQVEQTVRLANAAESREPGTLIHPLYGSQVVACASLATSVEYKAARRRTKLSFDFIEANPSMAPFVASGSAEYVTMLGDQSVQQSIASGTWASTANATSTARGLSNTLAN